MKKTLIAGIVGMLACLNACRFEPEWDVDALAPIAYTTLTPENLFRDSNLVVQPGGDLLLDYSAEVFEFPVDSLLRIPDTTFVYNFTSPLSITINPGFPLNVYDNYLLFNLPEIGMREAVMREGKLFIRVISKATRPTIINFEIPRATRNGVPFTFTDNLPAAPEGGTTEYLRKFDMSGYTIDFTGDNYDKYNKLRLKITATISPDADPLPVVAGQEIIRTEISFRGAKPYFAKGRIYKRALEIAEDTVKLPFFNLIKSGVLDIDAANLQLTVENGLGVDVQCVFSSVTGVNSRTGNSVALNHAILGNAININSAAMNLSAPPNFYPSYYPVTVTTTNSNLEDFAVNFPDKVSVNGTFTVNPYGNLSAGNDFVFDNSNASVHLHLTAPLAFAAVNLVLSDTVKFNGASLKKNNPIKKGSLKLYAENKYPVEMELKLSVVDSSGNVLFVPAVNQLIAAGIAQADGKVYQPVNSWLGITLTEQQFTQLTEAGGIVFEARFHTLPSPQLMKIYPDYFLKLKLMAEFTAGI